MKDTLSRLEFHKVKERILSYSSIPETHSLEILDPQDDKEKALDIYKKVKILMDRGYPLSIRIPGETGRIIDKIKNRALLDARELFLLSLFLHEVIKNKQDIEVFGVTVEEDILRDLLEKIERSIDEDGIKDDASQALYTLRRRQREKRDEIINIMNRIIMERESLLSSHEIHYVENRFLLVVKKGREHEMKGIVHGLSSSGHSVYFEPEEVVFIQNSLISIKDEIKMEEMRILKEMNSLVYRIEDKLSLLFKQMIEIDGINARYLYAVSNNCIIPQIGDNLIIKGGRHPLIDRDRVVPLDMEVPQHIKVLVVSGANAGGKTVLLKTVGLFALMVKAGIPIPASEGTVIPWFDKVMVDMGDEQSVEGGVSSFYYHLLTIKEMLDSVSNRDLLLIDELGTSTSPEEGSALGMAILKFLRDRAGLVIANTHLEKIKFMAEETEGMMNGHMAFSDGPEYRFVPGTPGFSNAMYLAEKMGLNKEVIKDAHGYMGKELYEIKSILKKLEYKLKEVMEKESEVEELRKRLEEKERVLKDMEEEIRKRYSNLRKEIKREKKRIILETRREMEHLIKRIKEEKASRSSIIDAKRKIESELSLTKEEEEMVEVKPGDTVFVESLKKAGEVIKVDGERCVVQIGVLKFNIERKGLKLVAKKEKKSTVEFRIPEEQFSPVLHIRHKTREEAKEMVEKFIDRALLYGFNKIYVVHGKHGGILRKALWDFASRDKRIVSYRLAEEHEGGRGVTVLELTHG